ncbi:hypothetical protein PI124_g19840 [Phytophthora idaei]|nr:hypothetical protein PI124_g19840 [Phytophthora idaei]
MQRAVYRINVSQREEMLELMMKMLYSPTLTAYESGYKALKQYCKTNKKQSFFAYFDKN